jgi:hypothetical protein
MLGFAPISAIPLSSLPRLAVVPTPPTPVVPGGGIGGLGGRFIPGYGKRRKREKTAYEELDELLSRVIAGRGTAKKLPSASPTVYDSEDDDIEFLLLTLH